MDISTDWPELDAMVNNAWAWAARSRIASLQPKIPVIRKRGSRFNEQRAARDLAIIGALQVPGITIREVVISTGASRDTIQDVMATLILPFCPCGRSGGHRGWCRWRSEQANKRKALLRERAKAQAA